ncbi:MAG: hypothetical protein QY302_08500 [Anaerolineales bacterium]|nr:MAG: hypothetical protein QY302_08500 [Anaerolineales bacterium]
MPPSFREARLRHAKTFAKQALQYKATGNRDIIQIEYGNILLGVETALEYQNYSLLADYVQALSENWVNKWDQYKRYVYPVVNNLDIQTVDKIQYLTNLATIEELQGNYRIARMLLKEKFDLLIALENKKDSDLFETTMQLAKLAKLQNDFQNLESVLLQALENAIGNDNAKQIADILLELALLPEIKTNYQKSMEYLSRGLVSADRIGYKIGAIDILVGKASICVLHKRFTEAKTSLKEAWDLAMNINDRQRIEEIRKQQQSLGVIMDKKIFISYNQTDRIFVKKLAEDLQTAGLLLNFDKVMTWGTKMRHNLRHETVWHKRTIASPT